MSERIDKWNWDELEKLAKAATPGPWHMHEGDLVNADHEYVDCAEDDSPNAVYIAAMDPTTCLALIAELRAQAAALERLTEGEDIHELRDLKARLKDAEQALDDFALNSTDPQTRYFARLTVDRLRKGR